MNVSSIIPVYNGEKFLSEAIESIMAQSYQSSEILVLDDGSTDNTRKIVEGFGSGVRYHYQSNRGLGTARNEAIRLARGEFLAFLDADDVWTKDKLSLQTNVVRDDPSIQLVGGHVENFFTPGLEESIRRQIRSPTTPQPAPVVPAMLIHRSVFERAGLFATSWKVGVDLDWFLRVKDEGIHVQILPEVVLRRRLHAANTGIVNSKFASQRLEILKSALDRRRRAEVASKKPDSAEPE